MTTLSDMVSALERPALGVWVKLSGLESCEIVASSGADFVVVDLEHSELTLDSAFRFIATISRWTRPFVRVPDLNRVTYQRLLDAGAVAILAPQIESVEDAIAGASFSLYPPLGVRGFSTTTRAGRWGEHDRHQHIELSNSRVSFIAQLESSLALRSLDEIAALPGLSGVFLGLADLSVSLGDGVGPEQEFARIVRESVARCKTLGIIVGTAVASASDFARRAKEGFDFIVAGDDASLLRAAVDSLVTECVSLTEELP